MDQANMDASTTVFNAQPQSRLLSLPGELRNRINREAAVKRTKIPVCTRYRGSPGKWYFSIDAIHPLLLACKQTRHELSEIYWTENVFELQSGMLETRKVRLFASLVGECSSKVTTLALKHSVETFRGRGYMCGDTVFISITRTESDVLKVVGRALTAGEQSPLAPICLCKVWALIDAHEMATVFDLAESYFKDLLSTREIYDKSRPVHCWTCAQPAIL